MVGLVAGSLTGIGFGVVLTAAVCSGLEHYGGVQFTKEPLVWTAAAGVVGGVVGGLVGRWSVTSTSGRNRPDDPA